MRDSDAYVMLMASLPHTKSLLKAKRPPLSRLKLEQRLQMLTEQDAQTLNLVEEALDWRKFPMSVTEDDVVKRANQLLTLIDNKTLQNIICQRLELRTCIAALRRRTRGEEAPQNIIWGFGRWVKHIERHWSDPTFQLSTVFPWLQEANKKMAEGDTYGLENLVLEQSYRYLQRFSGMNAFNIEAVVIYVLKWNIVERVTRYNAYTAKTRFNDLVAAGLTNYTTLFTEQSDIQ